MPFLRRWMTRLAAAALACVAVPAFAQPVIGDLPTLATGMPRALGVANPSDGSPRLFVMQQGGAIRVVRDDTLQPAAYFTLTAGLECRLTPGGALTDVGFVAPDNSEQGLLGLAFHPDFASNGHFFVSFSDGNGDSVIARYTASNPAADVLPQADEQSCLAILRVDQDFANHNGGNILFGPDGYLYFGLGDGGSGDDPCNRGQTLAPADLQTGGSCTADTNFTAHGGNANSRALLGKLVRIDVDNTTPAGSSGLCAARADGSANYAIPGGNPFTGGNAACDETYSYGLRNPWRWSFDRANGDFIVGDVGQSRWEEVSLSSSAALPGRNFDWKVCEGRHLRGQCAALCDALAASEVIIEYQNFGGAGSCGAQQGQGCSVTGGYRYRGPDARFTGTYFYGDACVSELRFSTESGGNWTPAGNGSRVSGLNGPILGFGEDDNGALYFVAGGNLHRVGIAGPSDLLFRDSFE